MMLNKQKGIRVVLVLFILSLSVLTIGSVKATDDYVTGTTHDNRVFGPYEFLVPYIEELGSAIAPQFAIGPTGTVSVVYADMDTHHVMYIDNATGSWSTPVEILDPQYINYEKNAITVDSSGNVYIITDGAVGQYSTNRSGSWVHEDLNLDNFDYNIQIDDLGDNVYIVTRRLNTGETPTDDEIVYINISYNPTYEYDRVVIDFPTFDPHTYDYIQSLDMDINSTGHVHCVWRGFEVIYHMVINPDGTYTTPNAISQTNGEVLSYCNWPQMDIDDNDEVHVIYTKNMYDSSNQSIAGESGVFYDVINSTTDGTAAVKLAPRAAGRAYITTGIGDDTRHVGSYQTFGYIQQVEYLTDAEGSWDSSFLTNFSYADYVQGMSVRDIEVNPVSNEPVILSTYRGHMELTSMVGRRWGQMIEFKTELDALEKKYPENLLLTMEIKNVDDRTIDLDTIAQVSGLAEIEFGNIEGNQQDVGIIAVDQTLTLNWELHYTGKFEGQLHTSLLVNENIDDRGYAGVYWEVGITLNIPGYSIWVLGLISIVSIGFILKKYKK
ncbi:MAG: hypothetical protein ACTSRE_02195 [Promethearchaeota archaeon]